MIGKHRLRSAPVASKLMCFFFFSGGGVQVEESLSEWLIGWWFWIPQIPENERKSLFGGVPIL